MGLSSSAVLLLVGTVSFQWRRHGSAVDASVLPAFPGYCSKDMSTMAIPSLSESVENSFDGVSAEDVELLQVHAMIRHGARTPIEMPKCWKGYDMTWDCNVTEVVSPSLSAGDGGVSTTGLFRKVYDAFPPDNVLGGTCMEGQLLDEGYIQGQDNGVHLRDAYVCSGSLCLFESASAADLQKSGALYLRSDDDQRTVMSGQILTASMLDVSAGVLDWHTGDMEQDFISPNDVACPRLAELSAEAFASAKSESTRGSFLATALNTTMSDIWGGSIVWMDVLDCLMTTACTGGELPDGLTEDVFEEAINYSTEEKVNESSFNNAAYGKLATAKLTLEIRDRIKAAQNGTASPRFALISGHDTTFIPFLSAVAPEAWDKSWPPYAALSTIELLRVGGGGGDNSAAGDYFRFVYSGKVLRLKGCDKDICAIDKFMEATQFAEDLKDNSHCCCLNMTMNATVIGTGSPSPVAVSGQGETLSPSVSGNSSITTTPDASNKSGLVESGASATSGSDSNDDSGGGGGSALGIAFACFLIGAIVGGVPALMYFRSFRYENLRMGGHSYEMT